MTKPASCTGRFNVHGTAGVWSVECQFNSGLFKHLGSDTVVTYSDETEPVV